MNAGDDNDTLCMPPIVLVVTMSTDECGGWRIGGGDDTSGEGDDMIDERPFVVLVLTIDARTPPVVGCALPPFTEMAGEEVGTMTSLVLSREIGGSSY